MQVWVEVGKKQQPLSESEEAGHVGTNTCSTWTPVTLRFEIKGVKGSIWDSTVE